MNGSVQERPMHNIQIPEQNFKRHIASNSYPGRGLVIGRSSCDDGWLMLYWIMGRSEHSRNRRFTIEGPVLWTEPVDPSRVEAPELIIYPAMLELPGMYIVSNGDQSQTIYDALKSGGTFDAALATREREPDAPNYTPRISGMLELSGTPAFTLNVLKMNPTNPDLTDRVTYRPLPAATRTGTVPYDLHGRWKPVARILGRSPGYAPGRRAGRDHANLLERTRQGKPDFHRCETHCAEWKQRTDGHQPVLILPLIEVTLHADVDWRIWDIAGRVPVRGMR